MIMHIQAGDTVLVKSDDGNVVIGVINISEGSGGKKLFGIVFGEPRFMVFAEHNVIDCIGRPVWVSPTYSEVYISA